MAAAAAVLVRLLEPDADRSAVAAAMRDCEYRGDDVTSATWSSASHFGYPVSTEHMTRTSIMGLGATRRLSAVRWGVAGNIVTAWVVTMPAAGVIAAAVGWPLRRVAG